MSMETDLETMIGSAVAQGARALIVGFAPPFMARREELVELTARYRLPAICPWREFTTEGGGLMSYGPDLAAAYHEVGVYTGRILKGASVGDLPVQLPTKFELSINLRTARALGISLSRVLNARADRVIE